MNILKSLLFAIPLSLFISCAKKNSTPNENPVSIANLNSSLEVFNKAFATSNLKVLDSMTAANYLHTNGNSQAITKSEWFSYLRKRDGQIKSGAIEVLSYSLNDPRIEMHKNTAIVTGKIEVIVRDSLETKTNQYRVTNIWIQEQGLWKRAGFHDGKIE